MGGRPGVAGWNGGGLHPEDAGVSVKQGMVVRVNRDITQPGWSLN